MPEDATKLPNSTLPYDRRMQLEAKQLKLFKTEQHSLLPAETMTALQGLT